MAAGLDLALGPASIFSSIPSKEIGVLIQKPNDRFVIIPAEEYGKKTRIFLDRSKIPAGYKKYLKELIGFEESKTNKMILTETINAYKELSETEVEKYFGEILGPLHIMHSSRSNYDNVVFPIRTNYNLFDFFMEKDGKYIGYSSKTGAGVSNTLSPTIISDRIEKHKIASRDKEVLFGRDVMVALGKNPIVVGLCIVAGMIVSSNKFPTSMSPAVKKAMAGVDWSDIALTLQNNRSKTIDKMGIDNFGKIDYFMSNYIVTRTKMSDPIKKAYITGKKKYTGNNVAYGLGMFIVDANKDPMGMFDCSSFLRVIFNDLNIIKLDLLDGVPSWKVKNLKDYTEKKFMFRSKYRWDVIKDKLGIAL